jgi:hypothetical protein
MKHEICGRGEKTAVFIYKLVACDRLDLDMGNKEMVALSYVYTYILCFKSFIIDTFLYSLVRSHC